MEDRIIAELRGGIDSLRDGQRKIEVKVDDLAELCAEIEHEIGGAPRIGIRGSRRSMRQRLHDLENDKAAATAAEAALAAATAVRKEAWTTFQKAGLFVFAGGGFVMALITLIHTVA